jgi:hypothetical protein
MPSCRPLSGSHADIMQRRLELDVEATEEGVRKECVDDMVAAVAALEAAVTLVVAAAEQPARRQPTPELITMCFEAVFGMLGASLRRAWAQQSRGHAAGVYAWCCRHFNLDFIVDHSGLGANV